MAIDALTSNKHNFSTFSCFRFFTFYILCIAFLFNVQFLFVLVSNIHDDNGNASGGSCTDAWHINIFLNSHN